RLQAAGRHSGRSAYNTSLGKLRVVAAGAPKAPLQPVRGLEDAAFTLDPRQLVLVAAVRHVFAEDHHARVARHLVAQASVDRVDHGLGLAVKLRWLVKALRRGVDGG